MMGTEPDALFLRIAAVVIGVILATGTVESALRSFVLPRSDRTMLTRLTMLAIYRIQQLFIRKNSSFAYKDAILAMHSPISMFALPLIWLALLIIGYAGIYWGISGNLTVREAFILSGSSLMTLGFAFQDEMPLIILSFSQAALSMMLIALLIGYLPTMYSAFSDREFMVTKLEAAAGTPPSPAEMLIRLDYTGRLYKPEGMEIFWASWQDWFVQLQQYHSTLVPMNFFRSPKPEHHWVTAAGTILDAAAITASSLEIEQPYQSGIVIRAGFVCLRTIADGFRLMYDPDPNPGDGISIKESEFNAVLDTLEREGLPVRHDRAFCWDHYSGWRVNYDEVLLKLARITNAPYAPWSSDRAIKWRPEDIPLQSPSILETVRVVNAQLLKSAELLQDVDEQQH